MKQRQPAACGGMPGKPSDRAGNAATHRGIGNAFGSRVGRAAAGVAGLMAAATVQAQVTEFPDGAQPLEPAALQERVNAKVFAARLANGVSWRLDYKSSGYFFIDVSTGARVAGKWAVDGSRLCHEPRGGGKDCTEMRLAGDRLLMKRTSNGEVVQLLPD